MEEVVALAGTIVISSSSVGISVGKYFSSCCSKAAAKLRGKATAVAKEQAATVTTAVCVGTGVEKTRGRTCKQPHRTQDGWRRQRLPIPS